MTPTPPYDEPQFIVTYTKKDLILYALAVGFGSNRDHHEEDLRFVYEDHPDFTAVPTFCVTFTFWAELAKRCSRSSFYEANNNRIPPFPPTLMAHVGVLPRRHLRERKEVDPDLPILHTFSSIEWFDDLPIPKTNNDSSIDLQLEHKVTSVAPKSMGTFVTTETKISRQAQSTRSLARNFRSADDFLCKVTATSLILGLDPLIVIPLAEPLPSIRKVVEKNKSPRSCSTRHLVVEKTIVIPPNQALVYRIASGDSNSIHVNGESLAMIMPQSIQDNPSPRPLLHGLCTLGIASRVILQYTQTLTHQEKALFYSFRKLQGRFSKPVFVGDTLLIEAWQVVSSTVVAGTRQPILSVVFQISNAISKEVVLDKGTATLVLKTAKLDSGEEALAASVPLSRL